MSKRHWVPVLLVLSVFGVGLSSDEPAKEPVGISPIDAWARLANGNARYATGNSRGERRDADRRSEVAKTQRPFAAVLTCSDSRVPPEVLFDQGLGDLFVVRNAGNSLDEIAVGSLQYAVDHLGTRLVVVLGHERCGACDAALKGGELPGALPAVVRPILPAVEATASVKENRLDAVIRNHAQRMARELRTRLPKGRCEVVAGRYDLDSGVVQRLP